MTTEMPIGYTVAGKTACVSCVVQERVPEFTIEAPPIYRSDRGRPERKWCTVCRRKLSEKQ